MSNKIGINKALEMLGVPSVDASTDIEKIKIMFAKLCIQDGNWIEVGNGKRLYMRSVVGMLFFEDDSEFCKDGHHELWNGSLTVTLASRYYDAQGTLLGHGLAGLATDGGLHPSSYDTLIYKI